MLVANGCRSLVSKMNSQSRRSALYCCTNSVRMSKNKLKILALGSARYLLKMSFTWETSDAFIDEEPCKYVCNRSNPSRLMDCSLDVSSWRIFEILDSLLELRFTVFDGFGFLLLHSQICIVDVVGFVNIGLIAVSI